ncbi:MAG: L-asparaginase [Vicingaceae bacterium]|jgi:L-asparaginase
MSKRTELLLIYTGGTIGMVEDFETGSLHPIDFSQLEKEIPELKRFDCNITVKSLGKAIDSSNMNIAVWRELLEIIESNYDFFDGFVIMHGSDTMAYTASAISFLLENVNKPIIFTGSQLPIGKIRTDGKENLITSIEIASAMENGKPIVPEVALYFEYSLYRGNRTTKVSAENFEAFQSPNYPLLAEAGVHIKYNRFAIRAWEDKKLIARKNIIDDVASIKIFPGLRRDVFQAIANMPNLKGLIIETFGSGNVPSDTWFAEEVTRMNERGVIVLNITQCTTGSVIQSKYETGVHLEQAGVISGKDMTFEAAITKLMYLLSCEELTDAEKRNYLDKNIRGEIS